MIRIALTLGYDGTEFHGWARQPGLRTVQETLEDALEMIVRAPVRVVVAGRTDAGVHARHQVVHFDLTEEQAGRVIGRSPDGLEAALVRRLDGTLARVLGSLRGSVVVQRAAQAHPAFDARFSALDRTYSYRIADDRSAWDPVSRHTAWWVPERLDIDAMASAARLLAGVHDFASFCKPREGATTIRGVTSAAVGRGADGLVQVRITADAFCHHMIRMIVAALAVVGRGESGPERIAARLAGQWQGPVPAMAPPHGLVLEGISYPPDAELAARNAVTRALRTPDLGGSGGVR
ncbi:tRNA pseudouridine(38-40) synthase TruA [Falsarthrobacter nasiphocae]|uniref:tRNA pseudouridine synthase A n=1 Tax=Falsarthrobacter nasiphocae TaxID=189863 RepID=A0AAE3YI26_9MICC|nr:tRNA pseudouridine(38-40) synthase TruA [Falsarthrobacter nasiphocae]MDR6892549.1 tRNA pseudouridine38-40 synthase [Falsarthrobacter nasiphocae]